MDNCKNCTNALYDELWGDYKCKVLQHVVYNPEDMNNCAYHAKGEPGDSAANEDYRSALEDE